MKAPFFALVTSGILCFVPCMLLTGCGGNKVDPKAEAPPPTTVEAEMDPNNFRVDNPQQFTLVTASEHKSVPTLNVTGVIQPDIARAVPVISLATGRVVEIDARLGDEVRKGQLQIGRAHV